jgi:hypothetical protein
MSARSGLRDRAFGQTIAGMLSLQIIRMSVFVAYARGMTKVSPVDNRAHRPWRRRAMRGLEHAQTFTGKTHTLLVELEKSHGAIM